MRHLLDGVVDLTCVDSSMHSSISTAPLVVSTITQQCLYLCHAASACQALLSEGTSSFWHIMRRVAAARERYVTSHSLPPSSSFIPKKSEVRKASEQSSSCAPRTDGNAGGGGTHVRHGPGFSPLAPHQQRQKLLLSPLELRVVVAGGGRVGRAIVERLLQAPDLIHPSRITIITRQTETVAQFAGRGVQCTGKYGGRQALLDCHVLVVACQQTQFYDFASIYCPRSTQNLTSVTGDLGQGDSAQPGNFVRRKQLCQRERRTLWDVLNKWRTMEDEEETDTGRGKAITRLLKPGTFIFSCCAALETHKIARELGHLDPLVVNADVDIDAAHSAAHQFQASKEALRSAFIQRAALEGNAFLTTLTVLQQKCMGGKTSLDEFCGDDVIHGVLGSEMTPRVNHRQRQHSDVHASLQAEGVGATASFLLRVWRALRCFVVAQVVSLQPAEHRLFMYLQRTGPLLGSVLVALPTSSREKVVRMMIELLNRQKGYDDDDDDDDGGKSGVGEEPLVKLDHRHVSAFDSDDDSDEYKNVSPLHKEVARLISCFPKLFKSEEDVLRQLRDEFIAVTEGGSGTPN